MPFFPAIMYEPDAYTVEGPKLMGRQSAGSGFLRALLNAADEQASVTGDLSLYAYTPSRTDAENFIGQVRQKSSRLQGVWMPANKPDLLVQVGGLFLPGPNISNAARQRLRLGPAAWCLTGMTHTLCSHGAMNSIIEMLVEPVMPWDALICTSSSARQSVEYLLQRQADYLKWRLGANRLTLPQLPVIPLGVHAADYDFDDVARDSARDYLGVADDEVVALFAGRLSFHAKAHPYPMLVALQEAAVRSGKRIRLILCGQFPNDPVKAAFLDGGARYAPDITLQWVDGQDAVAYRRAWVVSDLFISLSDNLQETFGLTPLEAMASGLPLVVSDWDGYKDTVIDGVHGFRIPTRMPPAGAGTSLAVAYEGGAINYDRYIGLAALDVSVDYRLLTDRLTTLISDAGLRATMGAAARDHVVRHYDWAVIFKKYLALWQELEEIRLRSADQFNLQQAPHCTPAREDPYRVFDSFPTQVIAQETLVSRLDQTNTVDDWVALCRDSLFSYGAGYLPKREAVAAILEVLSAPITVAALAARLNQPTLILIKQLAPMAKMGFIRLA